MHICESCGGILEDSDQVVATAQQVDVTSQASHGREFRDGIRSLWHARHWGDRPGYRKVAEGTLSELS
jgi:hypothetical protein